MKVQLEILFGTFGPYISHIIFLYTKVMVWPSEYCQCMGLFCFRVTLDNNKKTLINSFTLKSFQKRLILTRKFSSTNNLRSLVNDQNCNANQWTGLFGTKYWS